MPIGMDPVARAEAEEKERGDLLDFMLRMQERLQRESFGCDPQEMSTDKRVEYIRWNVLALTDELHEALGETSWKPWKQGEAWINPTELKDELVDAWHFMMNLLLASGMDVNELFYRYTAKHATNVRRMASGEYDGVKDKCPSCRRELDKEGSVVYWGEESSPADPPATYSCKGCGATVPEGSLTSATRERVRFEYARGLHRSTAKRRLSGFCDVCGGSFTSLPGPYLRSNVTRDDRKHVTCCGKKQFFKQLQRYAVEDLNGSWGMSYTARGANRDDVTRRLAAEGRPTDNWRFNDAETEIVEGT